MSNENKNIPLELQYDAVYILDLNTQTFERIRTIDSVRRPNGPYELTTDVFFSVLRGYIHPSDQELFDDFVNRKTLVTRLKKCERGILTEYMRISNTSGAYVWKSHTMQYIEDKNQIIYTTQAVPFTKNRLIQRVAPDYLIEGLNGYKKSYHKVVSQALLDSKTINLFWKDRERRFLGANSKFLETYGFKDISEILGKTDEEMGWHKNAEPFRDDEYKVIQNGEVIINRIGKCIIKGVEHNILVYKEPLYENGVIVGLVGYFINLDEMEDLYSLVGTALDIMDKGI